MSNIQAACKVNYPLLRGILDEGDMVTIESILYEKDTILVHQANWPDGSVFIPEDIISPKGSYKGWRFKSKNGHYYDNHCIYNAIGFKSLGELFNKIEDEKA